MAYFSKLKFDESAKTLLKGLRSRVYAIKNSIKVTLKVQLMKTDNKLR